MSPHGNVPKEPSNSSKWDVPRNFHGKNEENMLNLVNIHFLTSISLSKYLFHALPRFPDNFTSKLLIRTSTLANLQISGIRTSAKVEITENIREWDYGSYEGITSAQIRSDRKAAGLPEWDIWRDGCPDGESPEQVTERIDALISDIRSKYHGPVIGKDKKEAGPGDVLIVAHGHILRAFAMRWVGKTLQDGPTFLLEAGGVGTLSYEHKSLEEPAILLGGAFMVDVVENSVEDEKEKEGK